MSRRKTKKRPPVSRKITCAVVVTIAVLSIAGIAILNRNDTPQGITESEFETEPAEIAPDTKLELPVKICDDRLELVEAFPYSGINPDAGGTQADDTAALIVRNISDEYLISAQLTANFESGAEYDFYLSELPAGESAMLFSTENAVFQIGDVCTGVTANAVFDDTDDTHAVTAVTDGMTVELTNTSDSDISDVDVYCRNILDKTYFGGTSYKYTIAKLPSGESITFVAEDCFLGNAEVVRISANN